MTVATTTEGFRVPKGRAPFAFEPMAKDVATLLAASRRVRDYRHFLAQCRSAKSRGASADLGRLVLSQARALRTPDLEAAAARSIRSLSTIGGFEQASSLLRIEAGKGYGLRSADIWSRLSQHPKLPELSQTYGVEAGDLEELGQALADVELTLTTQGGDLTAVGLVAGRPLSVKIVPQPTTIAPRTALDVLMSGRLQALCDGLEAGEPAYLTGANLGLPVGTASFEFVALATALNAQREAVRHVRKLEDVGLSTYAGAEPGTLGIIALTLFVAGIIIGNIECKSDHWSSGISGDDHENGWCYLAFLLYVAGFIVGFVALGSAAAAIGSGGLVYGGLKKAYAQ